MDRKIDAIEKNLEKDAYFPRKIIFWMFILFGVKFVAYGAFGK